MRLFVALLVAFVVILLLCQPCSAEGEWRLYTITFYSGGDVEQGTEDGITASGLIVSNGHAASYEGTFPFGTQLEIAGWGVVEIQDTGIGLVNGEPWVDIFLPDRNLAFQLGVIKLWVKVL